jgi:hypothetical protein
MVCRYSDLYSGVVYHINPVNTIGAFFTALSTDPMNETTELEPFGTEESSFMVISLVESVMPGI